MVIDHKMHITYATTKLGAMLGFSARQLAGADLTSIIPPPASQLHAGFMRSLGAAPPPTSCRAGAVVHLLRANGAKVPVTLQMSSYEDGDRAQHVVRVLPATEGGRLDRQRVVLSVGEGGTVMGVNAGASKVLFGFAPEELLGLRLASCVNVFKEW